MKQTRLVIFIFSLSFSSIPLQVYWLYTTKLRLITTPEHCVHSPTRLLNFTPGLTLSLMKKKKQQQELLQSPQWKSLRSLRSLKWAACQIHRDIIGQNPWKEQLSKGQWNIHWSTLPFFFVFIIQHQVCRGRLLEDFFAPLWLDLDLSGGLSEVSPLIFFTIPAMKLSRVLLQPSLFNDSSLLKSRDFTEVAPGHSVHWILAFNTFLSFDWVKHYKAV